MRTFEVHVDGQLVLATGENAEEAAGVGCQIYDKQQKTALPIGEQFTRSVNGLTS